MDIKIAQKNNISIALVQGNGIIITDTQSALDFIASVWYETGCNCVAIQKSSIIEDFFKLSTRLAGDVLQKFINYNMKIAIIGDFSCYTSKPLKDFIYESNNGNNVFFVANEDAAVEKLSCTK